MSKATIYFNAKCGTCHKTLALLEEKGFEAAKIDYLKNPPSEAELDDLLKKLNVEPEQLARKKEPVYKVKTEGKSLTRAQWLTLFHENPILIERPVVVIGQRAVIARPPEKLLEIL
jgi:arsenate reductase